MFSADLGGYTAPLPAATDPPFQKVSLLLHGDGTNGAQNNTFLDSSPNNFTITRTGNVAQGTFSPFSLADGQWSTNSVGTTGFTVAQTTATDLGSGDFTVECFVFPTAAYSSTNTIITKRRSDGALAGSWALGIQSSRYVWFGGVGSGTVLNASTGAVPLNTWSHIVACRSGSTMSIFVNGTRVATTTATDNYTCSQYTFIGLHGNSSGIYPSGTAMTGGIVGYISNIRLTQGTAVYSASATTLTVPTSALTAITNTSLLACQSNRFKDNSSNNLTITPYGTPSATAFSSFAPSAVYSASTNGGSGYFDGSGDYLTTPDNVALELPTQDFTLECFTYLTALPASTFTYPLIQKGYNANTTSEYQLAILNSSGTYTIIFNQSTSGTFTGSLLSSSIASSALINQWNHIAFTRVGTVGTFWFNGVNVGTVTVPSTLFARSGVCSYGSNPVGTSGYVVTGYLANIRIIKGSAIYTANFTPPTSPLTAISGTSLLLNCTNAGIIDNAGKNDIETVGNAQISISIKKYGTGSMYFDGSTGGLDTLLRPELNLSTGDFTVEFWFNSSSGASATNIPLVYACASNVTGASDIQYRIAIDTSGTTLTARMYVGGTSYGITTTTISTGTWYHYALVRFGSTFTVYLNGVSVGTPITGMSSALNSNPAWLTRIGRYSEGSLSYYAGYIDDLRITKGQALYTANFTPPTQAFPDV